MAAVDQRDQIFINQMSASGHVDHIAPRLQSGQRFKPHDVTRVRREWQQTHQHTRSGQKSIQLLRAGKTAHAFNDLGRPAPAIHREFKRGQRFCNPLTQHTQTHHADGKLRATSRLPKRPNPLRHIGREAVELTKVSYHGVTNILSHLR